MILALWLYFLKTFLFFRDLASRSCEERGVGEGEDVVDRW